MKNSTWNADKVYETGQNNKTKEKRWNMYEQEWKGNTKNSNTAEEINRNVLAKEGRLKRYREIISTKQEIPKERKEILLTSGGGWHETYNQPEQEKRENFSLKCDNQENITKKMNG